MYEVRVARLESDVDNVKSNISDIKVELREMRKDWVRETGTLKEDLVRETTALKNDIVRETTSLRKEARTDFRLMFSAIIFVSLGLASLIAKTFHWL